MWRATLTLAVSLMFMGEGMQQDLPRVCCSFRGSNATSRRNCSTSPTSRA